jgi:membrane-associated phospholipid phosphatase
MRLARARSRLARNHLGAYLSMHGVVGLALAIACAWAFFAIADEVPEHGRMITVDTVTVSWLQTHGTETGESIFDRIGWLGSAGLTWIVAIAALTFLSRRSWRRFTLVAVCSVGAWLLNQMLKAMFHRERPSAATEFVTNGSFSFPSGHAMESIAVYGVIAYLIVERFPPSRSLVRLGWLCLVAVIGFSRVYLGVHYASDVAAGFAAGFVWLFTCISAYRFIAAERG